MDGSKIVSWEELDALADVGTKTVLCPDTSAALGREVFVKVRGLSPDDLCVAYDFPMDEIRALAAKDDPAAATEAALREHVAALSVEDVSKMVERTVRVGLVAPKPEDGDVSKLSRDFQFLFMEIMELTSPKEIADVRARFRDGGERGSA